MTSYSCAHSSTTTADCFGGRGVFAAALGLAGCLGGDGGDGGFSVRQRCRSRRFELLRLNFSLATFFVFLATPTDAGCVGFGLGHVRSRPDTVTSGR